MTAPAHEQGTKAALVLVDHGSRCAQANSVVEDCARSLAENGRGRYVGVYAAHMELAAPSIEQAFEAAAAAGAELVVVVLFFLAPGRHSSQDVPRLAAEAAARHPGLRHVITRPLGPDPVLDDLVLLRVREALAAGPLDR
ncbi:MAG TPA: CbiX/SirB N-terminal domain-containing protein [Candidatus Limnocylindrales bacterium]|nr:CbiX/SirB N-terminal domain-containing protein [Candidatus Limnocylindrales bacterium]